MARAALQYYPLPNREGTAANANNYVGNSDSTLDRDILVARVDHQLRHGRPADRRATTSTTAARTSPGRTAIPSPIRSPMSTSVRVQSLTGAHTHIFTPTLVNELRLTYLRRKFIDQRPGLGTDPRRCHRPARRDRRRRSRRSTIPGYASLSNAARLRVSRRRFSIARSSSRCRGRTGRHAFKFGGEFRAGANDEIRDRGSSGSLTFTPLITSNLGAANTGNALAVVSARRGERRQRADFRSDSDRAPRTGRSTRRTTGA